jgi:ubiquinone/menaquinone biosynthesis C-methylase UbiE
VAHRVCPWWIGYLLLSPFRRWGQNPNAVLGPYVTRGMTVLDVGCAMGFFTLDLARLVGSNGRVIAVDLQSRMLRSRRPDRNPPVHRR